MGEVLQDWISKADRSWHHLRCDLFRMLYDERGMT